MTSPQRRVPLPLSSVPTEEKDVVAQEIDEHCRSEQTNFTLLGSLTPRRNREVDETSSSNAGEFDAWKHRAFQPRRPAETTVASTEVGSVAAPIPAPPGTYHGKKLYLELQKVFDILSENSEQCESRLGLYALSLACQTHNPMIRWVPVTSLDVAIQSRRQILEAANVRSKETLAHHIAAAAPQLSEHERFEKHLQDSRMEAAHGAYADSAALTELEKRIAREEDKRRRDEEERKRLGEERLRAAKEAAQLRKAERERRLQSILDKDEETREEWEAVNRVRAKLEEEKTKGSHSPKAAT